MSLIFWNGDKRALKARPEQKMRLVYFDESGLSAKEPILVIAALIVEADGEWSKGQAYLEESKEFRLPRELRSSFEYHAVDLFNGSSKTLPRNRYSREIRDALLFDMSCLPLAVSSPNEGLPIIYGAIDKHKLASRYKRPWEPVDLAFLLCVERVERWFKKNAPTEKALFIADKMTRELSIKRSIAEYRLSRIPLGVKDEKLEHVIDTIHFADSRETWGIQAADHAAFFIRRFLLKGQKDRGYQFYELLNFCIEDHRTFPE